MEAFRGDVDSTGSAGAPRRESLLGQQAAVGRVRKSLLYLAGRAGEERTGQEPADDQAERVARYLPKAQERLPSRDVARLHRGRRRKPGVSQSDDHYFFQPERQNMILANLQYPRFVPDQVLTSDNLDDLFTYLDDQDRITHTNLIGIGIVCGLTVETPADGTIKITKGTGVTSEGYLVSHADTDRLGNAIEYTKYITFDPTKEDVYDKFKPKENHPPIQLWELKESAAVEGTTPLNAAFLN